MPDTKIARYTHAKYLDEIEKIDALVGKTIEKLEQDGLLEDTFVFYFGDHGGVLPRSKGYAYDDGVHVPLVVRVPENFKHLVDANANQTITGFVEFVDFGPTLLALAGIETPAAMDGKPFLGPKVNMVDVDARDQTFSYADRFDEKYDLVRTLRKGKFLYMRNYQPFLPDGLQNNYRYRMLAFTEWRDLYKADKLNDVQKQFHQPKKVEALYDVESDPFNVKNLASDPAYADVLSDLRQRLQQKVKSLPDLSFYSESYLIKHDVFKNAVAFGQSHEQEIASIIETADYALLNYGDAKPKILQALSSEVEAKRMWAITAAASFGQQAIDIEIAIQPLIKDRSMRVRLRAAEYVGLLGVSDPQSLLADIINNTDEPVLVLEALNSVVLFNDYFGDQYPVNLANINPLVSGSEIDRRLNYLKEPNKLH
ncbi:MAG: sulfatase-like hydrolase/transferase [Kordiimonadaceae bacterium]|nr:sulfatase-like hydrolase/transferase [Kordiimonadaceae bacterium]